MKQKKSTVLFFTLSVFCLFAEAYAADVALAWDPVSSSALAGYKLYYGTVSRSYPNLINIGKQTSYTITGLQAGQTYYFTVSAYDSSLNETSFSNEVSTQIAPQAPVISDVQNTILTSDSATIRWTTDLTSDSAVDFGLSTSYGQSATNGNLVLTHNQTLTNLSSNKLYHYRVRSKTSTGGQATSGDFTFTTLAAAGDTTPPAISGITTSSVTFSSAVISWTTNEASNSQVRYGTSSSYGLSKTDATMVTAHSLSLSGLQANTTYHYCVISADAAGNATPSANVTFSTPAAPGDTTPPVISTVAVSSITYSGATVSWRTSEGATSRVEYGTSTAYGMTSSGATLVTQHSRSLSSLQPNTTYHYRVVSTDAAGNIARSGNYTFRTAKRRGRSN